MNNEQCTTNNEKINFTQQGAPDDEQVDSEQNVFEEAEETDAGELTAEILSLKARIDMLVRDNAELITDNLTLRAKTEALLEARAALPEFSVKTEVNPDKYAGIRETFKNKRR